MAVLTRDSLTSIYFRTHPEGFEHITDKVNQFTGNCGRKRHF
jgi:hypothetical protein